LPLAHSFGFDAIDSNADASKQIDISVLWAKEAEVVFWRVPPRSISDHTVLFDSYGEFVLWTTWKLGALFRCSEIETSRIRGELEALRVTIISPRRSLESPAVTRRPLTVDIELR
jgi:hypothetical protein